MGKRWKDSTLSILFNPSYSCLRRMWVRQAAGGKKSEPPSFERESKKCPWIQPFLPHSPSHIRIRYTAYRRGRVKRDPLAPLTSDKRGVHWTDFNRGIWSNASVCLASMHALLKWKCAALSWARVLFPSLDRSSSSPTPERTAMDGSLQLRWHSQWNTIKTWLVFSFERALFMSQTKNILGGCCTWGLLLKDIFDFFFRFLYTLLLISIMRMISPSNISPAFPLTGLG